MANGSPFTHRIPHFFDLLSTQAHSIPIQSQWVLYIHSFPSRIISQVREFEDYTAGSGHWSNVAILVDNETADPVQRIKGCIFANQINTPTETLNIERPGDNYKGGFVKGPVSTSRADFNNFTVSFLETNASFADMVLRPWAIMVAHYGLIARENESADNRIKTNMTVYHLAKAGYGVSPIIRKQFNFYGVVPINISSDDYTSDAESATKTRQVDFLYNYYTADADPAITSNQ
jgi:hypothetical protein